MNGKKPGIVLIIASVIFVGAVGFLVYYFGMMKRADDVNSGLAQMHTSSAAETVVITQATTTETTTEATTTETTTEATTTETTIVTTEEGPLVLLDSMAPFVQKNADTAGWIKVGGTTIDNVIVHTDNNDYYLNHDYYGNYSQPGTIFADFRCVVNDFSANQSDNIVLYGHNQANGSMFGTLQRYKVTKQNTSRFDFYLEHPTFEFSNLYHEYTYKIIAAFVIEVEPRQTRTGEVFDYQNYIRFGSKSYTYDEWMENIMARTEIITGVDVEKGDKFLTLSTCSNEFEPSRFLVIGRRVREGEDPYVDTSLARLNPDAVEPDWNYIYGR